MLTVVTFQLSSSQGGWLLCPILPLPCTYFNSQPHKEADLDDPVFVFVDHISTHSLTRRLTFIFAIVFSPSEISTHSLTRRLTRRLQFMRFENLFQLTASQGGWPVSKVTAPRKEKISTHSLTRRLTPAAELVSEPIKLFQLTASQGGWPGITRVVKFLTYFNSQPHKEADPLSCWYSL